MKTSVKVFVPENLRERSTVSYVVDSIYPKGIVEMTDRSEDADVAFTELVTYDECQKIILDACNSKGVDWQRESALKVYVHEVLNEQTQNWFHRLIKRINPRGAIVTVKNQDEADFKLDHWMDFGSFLDKARKLYHKKNEHSLHRVQLKWESYLPDQFLNWLEEDTKSAILSVTFYSRHPGDYGEDEGQGTLVSFRTDLDREFEELHILGFDPHDVCMKKRKFAVPLEDISEILVCNLVPSEHGSLLEPYAVWMRKTRDHGLFRFQCQYL